MLLPALRLQSLNPNLAKILLLSPSHRGLILILYPKRNPPMCVECQGAIDTTHPASRTQGKDEESKGNCKA